MTDLQYLGSAVATICAGGALFVGAVRVYSGYVRTALSLDVEPVCPNCNGVGHVPAVTLGGSLEGGRKRCNVCMPDPIKARHVMQCELA